MSWYDVAIRSLEGNMVPIETIRNDWGGYREMILEERESLVLFGKKVMGLYRRVGPGR